MTTEKRKRKRFSKESIPAIVGKLGGNGLTKSNYTRSRAEEILSGCVYPTVLINTLEKFESVIVEGLQA